MRCGDPASPWGPHSGLTLVSQDGTQSAHGNPVAKHPSMQGAVGDASALWSLPYTQLASPKVLAVALAMAFPTLGECLNVFEPNVPGRMTKYTYFKAKKKSEAKKPCELGLKWLTSQKFEHCIHFITFHFLVCGLQIRSRTV